jgi:pyruvate formate lyase activating enzyme
MTMTATASGLHEARFWREDGGRIVCTLCPRGCRLGAGQSGFCGVRQRVGDRLLALAYGRPASVAVDPIEKKPLYHVLPGASILSIGTAGCNLSCRCCQNWSLARGRVEELGATELPPDQVAAVAVREGCAAVAFTYNEPTVFAEYAEDAARACRAAGLLTVMVTNGYITEAAAAEIYPWIDAANVDLKFFSDELYHKQSGGHLAPVLRALEVMRAAGTFVEITTLIIPGLNDDDDQIGAIADWIGAHLGADTPFHLSAFHPDFRLRDRPRTPVATLERARRVALGRGLHHVYGGNVASAEMHTTTCPSCGATLICRSGFSVIESRLRPGGRCPCGRPLAGRF